MSVISWHPLTASAFGPHLAARRGGGAVVPGGDRTLAVLLLGGGLVQGHAMVRALNRQAEEGGRLIDILLAQGLVTPAALYAALARHSGAGLADLVQIRPDVRLIDALGPVTCLAQGLLPWRRQGGTTVIATA